MTTENSVCSRCNESKPLDCEHFVPAKTCVSGFRSYCRECYKADLRRRYQEDPEPYKARRKRNYEKDIELSRAKSLELYYKNHEESRRKRNEYGRLNRHKQIAYVSRKGKSDPKFRIRNNISAKFRQFVKNKPQGGFQKIVGYKVSELYDHLESLFTPEMSWDNYGKYWEIDHIRPVSSFDLPDEIKECWALTNLRPLSATENRRKSNKLNYVVQAERNLSDGQSLSPELERGQ